MRIFRVATSADLNTIGKYIGLGGIVFVEDTKSIYVKINSGEFSRFTAEDVTEEKVCKIEFDSDNIC